MGAAPVGPSTSAVITVANPAAGANWQYTVPANNFIHLVGIHFTFESDANAANRVIGVNVDDGAVAYYYSMNTTLVPLNSVARVTFAPGHSDVGVLAATRLIGPLGHFLYIPSGHRINSEIISFQATDQMSGIRLLTERFVS